MKIVLEKAFLRNERSENYQDIFQDVMKIIKKYGCFMNFKLQFLHSNFESFPENLEKFSDEQGERFVE